MSSPVLYNYNKTDYTSYPVLVKGAGNDVICSFTEFLPFNADIFYFSSFKAFDSMIPA